MSVRITLLALALLLIAATGTAQTIRLDPPDEREFILDLANLIDADDETSIRQECDQLLTDTGSPLIIVTIESMAKHTDDRTMRIETFAMKVFNQWGVGHVEIEGRAHNRGMLLVVSRDDRKARIELGAGWGDSAVAQAQWIVDGTMIPRFKRGEFSEGIKTAALALAAMARGPTSGETPDASTTSPGAPASPPPTGGGFNLNGWVCVIVAVILVALVVIGPIISRALHGSSSGVSAASPMSEANTRSSWMNWLPLMWMMSQSSGGAPNRGWWSGGGRGFGGGGFGGFSGGSFGGGFSGGRGASGGW